MARKSFSMALRKAMLAALAAMGGNLHAATLMLFSNTLSIGPRTVVANLTECTFDGYAAVAPIAFGTPYTDETDGVNMSAPSVQFTATGGTVSEVINGWALVKADKTELYYAALLDEPVSIDEAGDAAIIQPTVTYNL